MFPGFVEDHSSIRLGPVSGTHESVQDRFFPTARSRAEFVNCAADVLAATGSAPDGGAVYIPARVKNRRSHRVIAVTPVCEGVERLFVPGAGCIRKQLEDLAVEIGLR